MTTKALTPEEIAAMIADLRNLSSAPKLVKFDMGDLSVIPDYIFMINSAADALERDHAIVERVRELVDHCEQVFGRGGEVTIAALRERLSPQTLEPTADIPRCTETSDYNGAHHKCVYPKNHAGKHDFQWTSDIAPTAQTEPVNGHYTEAYVRARIDAYKDEIRDNIDGSIKNLASNAGFVMEPASTVFARECSYLAIIELLKERHHQPAPAPSDARERAVEALYLAASYGTRKRCEAAVDAILAAAQSQR